MIKNNYEDIANRITYYCKMEVDINNRSKENVTKSILKCMDNPNLSQEQKNIFNKVLSNLKSGGYYVG